MTEPDPGSSIRQQNPAASKKHPVLRKLAIWSSSLVLFFTFLLVITPVVVKHIAESWLQDNGAAEASIGNIDINPFTGKVLLSALNASNGTQSRLIVDTAELDIRWRPLISKRAYVEGLLLSGVKLDIVLDEQDAWHIGGLRIAPVNNDQPEETVASPALWGFGSEFVRLADVELTYRDSLVNTNIQINEIRLGQQFSWETALDTEFMVDMTINGAPLKITSNVAPWAEKRSFRGDLILDNFNLANHSRLLEAVADISNITGILNMNLDIGASITSEGILEVSLSGPFSLENIAFNQGLLSVNNQLLRWDGIVKLQLPANDTQPLIQLEGELAIENTEITDPAISLENQTLNWQGTFMLATTTDNGKSLELEGKLELADTAVEQATMSLANQSTRWEGRLVSGQLANSEAAQLSAAGSLISSGISTILPAQELSAVMADMAWNGELEYIAAAANDPPAINMLATLSANGLSASHAQLPFDLFTIAGFEARDIAVTDFDQASISQRTLQGTRLLATREGATTADNTVLTLEELAVSTIILEPDMALRIDQIQLVNPAFKLIRNTRGDLVRIGRTLEIFSPPAEPASDTDTPPAPESSPFQLVIGELSMQSGNLLAFQDRSVEPPASFRLAATTLETGTIDTSGAVPTDISITTGNANMTFATTGSVNLFSNELLANLDIKLAALDLPPVSPYLPGFNIDRGRLSTNTTVVISGDLLDVQNALTVEGLTMNSKALEGSAAAAGMGMPIDVALDLLRDGNDRIILDIPVTGSLSDPQFGTADVVRVIVQRALQNAAMSFVTNALQPLGAILMVGNLAEKASRPRFEPVKMLPGEFSLTPTDRDYLLKMADLLEKRPKLSISICSVSTTADREMLLQLAMDKQEAEQASLLQTTDVDDETTTEPELPLISDQELLELAASRSSAVSDFLAQQANIDRSRLFNCRDTIETGNDAVSRVTITL